MRLYKDGNTIDVQPKVVGRYEQAGWSRTPPKSSRRTRRDSKPDEQTSGDVSTEQGES